MPPKSVDDAAERVTDVGMQAAHAVRRIINGENFLDQLPERGRDVPNQRQHFCLATASWVGSVTDGIMQDYRRLAAPFWSYDFCNRLLEAVE